MTSKKPSGAWFEKQRKLKESSNQSLSASLGKWLLKPSVKENLVVPSQTDKNYEIKVSDNATNPITTNVCESVVQNDCYSDQIAQEKHDDFTNFDFNDPAKWPKITPRLKAVLIEHGPPTSNQNYYPHDENNRHFSNKWFFKKLTNGEQVQRQWLMYSVSKNKLFCFPCILFCTTNCAFVSGFGDWQHSNPRLPDHEFSLLHKQNCIKWKELE